MKKMSRHLLEVVDTFDSYQVETGNPRGGPCIRMQYTGGRGMRVLGRLAMATALLIPIGVLSATAASAGPGAFDCTGTTGTVTASPGLLLASSAPQKMATSSAAVTCTGGFVTGGTLSGTAQTPTVRCTNLVGQKAAGTAKIVWNTSDHAGTTTLKLNLKFTASAGHSTDGKFVGLVTTSGGNLFAGRSITGTFTLGKGLSSINADDPGDCSATQRLKSFPITALEIKTA